MDGHAEDQHEADVPGTERSYLDQGHVIADSLGGVSNAYNITPQDSTLNRHGDQAYMEKVIRDAGGVTNFVAKISYHLLCLSQRQGATCQFHHHDHPRRSRLDARG